MVLLRTWPMVCPPPHHALVPMFRRLSLTKHQDEVVPQSGCSYHDNWIDLVPITDGFQRDWQAALPRIRRSLSGREGKTGPPMRPRLLCTLGRWKTKKKKDKSYIWLRLTTPPKNKHARSFWHTLSGHPLPSVAVSTSLSLGPCNRLVWLTISFF